MKHCDREELEHIFANPNTVRKDIRAEKFGSHVLIS